MPWLEMSPVEERERFIDDHRFGLYDMTELCARYAVSRKTGYTWLARYDGDGRPALRDRSRAPHRCPHKIADAVAQLLLTARRHHPDWGPEKLLQWLEYPGHFLVKRVTNAGTIRFKTRLLYLSTALKQHRVGLEEVEDGFWSLHLCDVVLGRID